MATHADWANLLTHGSATQNASPPFVPTVRVQYGGKSVNDMSRVQDPLRSPAKPLSAGGKQRQSSPHDSGPRDSTNHRKSSASHVDDVTQPQESRRGRSQASASGSRDIRFSPSTPKRSATQTQAHGNDGGAAGGDREKTSRSRSIHAEHHSPLLDSHATSANSSGAEQMEQRARLQLQEKLRTRAAKREPHAQAASPTKAPSTSWSPPQQLPRKHSASRHEAQKTESILWKQQARPPAEDQWGPFGNWGQRQMFSARFRKRTFPARLRRGSLSGKVFREVRTPGAPAPLVQEQSGPNT